MLSKFEPSAAIWISQMGDCKMNIEVTVTIEGLKESIKNRTSLVKKAVKRGFEVEYWNRSMVACKECEENGGKCVANGTYTYQFNCIPMTPGKFNSPFFHLI